MKGEAQFSFKPREGRGEKDQRGGDKRAGEKLSFFNTGCKWEAFCDYIHFSCFHITCIFLNLLLKGMLVNEHWYLYKCDNYFKSDYPIIRLSSCVNMRPNFRNHIAYHLKLIKMSFLQYYLWVFYMERKKKHIVIALVSLANPNIFSSELLVCVN